MKLGIVGLPNVGKSTILSVVTSARPKIGNYHFTTLTPNLGVLIDEYDPDQRMVIADIDVEYISTRRTARNTFYYPEAPEMRVVEIDVDEICYQGDVRRHIEPIYFVPEDEAARAVHCREVFAIQSAGLARW